MTKESLMQMGLTDEQATKVMEALNGTYKKKQQLPAENISMLSSPFYRFKC